MRAHCHPDSLSRYYEPSTPQPWTEVLDYEHYGHVVLDVTTHGEKRSLKVSFVANADGSVVDEFEIEQ